MDAEWANDENAKGEKHRKYDGCMDAGRVVEGTVYRDVILRENIIMVDVATNQNTERDGHDVAVSPINDMPAVLNRKQRDMHTHKLRARATRWRLKEIPQAKYGRFKKWNTAGNHSSTTSGRSGRSTASSRSSSSSSSRLQEGEGAQARVGGRASSKRGLAGRPQTRATTYKRAKADERAGEEDQELGEGCPDWDSDAADTPESESWSEEEEEEEEEEGKGGVGEDEEEGEEEEEEGEEEGGGEEEGVPRVQAMDISAARNLLHSSGTEQFEMDLRELQRHLKAKSHVLHYRFDGQDSGWYATETNAGNQHRMKIVYKGTKKNRKPDAIALAWNDGTSATLNADSFDFGEYGQHARARWFLAPCSEQ